MIRRYRWVVAALAVAVPLLTVALRDSLAWPGRVFPGFLVMRNAVVPTVSGFDWPPDRAAVFHGRVLAVDGVATPDGAAVWERVATRAPGEAVRYTLARDGTTQVVVLPARRFTVTDWWQTFGVLLGFGCAWLAGGLAVGLLRPDSTPARIFLLQSLAGGLFAITAVFLYTPGAAPLTPLHLAIECLFPATILHLALVFPVERLHGWQRRAALGSAYGLGALLAGLAIRGFDAAPPDLTPIYRAYQFAALSFATLIAALAVRLWRARDEALRARVLAVLPGAMLAGALAVFAVLDSALTGRQFPLQFGLLFTPLFLAGIGYAVARHDLFDVDRLVRRTFTYALLSVVVAAGYAAVVAGSAALFGGSGPEVTLVRGAAFLALALLVEPLRRRLQTLIDRTFYRARLSYRRTIASLSRALSTLLDLDAVADQVTHVVTESMQLEWAAILLPATGDAPGRAWLRHAEGALVSADPPAALPRLAARAAGAADPAESGLLAALDGALTDPPFAGLAARMALPLALPHGEAGVLLLGARRSGRGFDGDDIALLRTLADQTAIAVQNARSYRQLEELTRTLDAQVRERTAALRDSNAELRAAYEALQAAQAQLVQSEKMASLGQLVAGAAHELNNPVSFVHGGIETIADYFARLLEFLRACEALPAPPEAAARLAALRAELRIERVLSETPALLRICAEGSERIRAIVEDLRVFVRADGGERAPVDVAAGIETTLRLLADRLAPAGIAVHTALQPVPAVPGHAGQLNQVWMNLLTNAIDALRGVPAPRITVATRRLDGTGRPEQVEIEVADNGPGIAPEVLPRIFDPFFTTKPIGQGTGLGLSIAWGAVKAHGGEITVDSVAGRGAVLRVRLPVA